MIITLAGIPHVFDISDGNNSNYNNPNFNYHNNNNLSNSNSGKDEYWANLRRYEESKLQDAQRHLKFAQEQYRRNPSGTALMLVQSAQKLVNTIQNNIRMYQEKENAARCGY
jgi:hypothetical protein